MCKGVGLGDILNILRDCLAVRGVPPKWGCFKVEKAHLLSRGLPHFVWRSPGGRA